MRQSEWVFDHNFIDAGAMIQSAYHNRHLPELQLNVYGDDGNAFLFEGNRYICRLETRLERKA